MTDNDIIKALEYCVECGNCATCMYKSNCIDLPQDILNIVVRQKAEIKKLKNMVAQNEGVLPEYERLIKHEAIEEFAKKLKEKGFSDQYYEHESIVYVADIDDLVKEMTEGEDA